MQPTIAERQADTERLIGHIRAELDYQHLLYDLSRVTGEPRHKDLEHSQNRVAEYARRIGW